MKRMRSLSLAFMCTALVAAKKVAAVTTPPPSPAIGTWAELESACQKSGTYTLSSTFKMGSYTKEIHFGGKKLVIWGKNATLDAAKKGRFFSSTLGPNNDDDDHAIPDTSLELHDLVLQNGDAEYVSVKILDLFSELSEPALFAPCGAVGIRTVLGRGNYNRKRHSHNSGVHFSGQHGVR